MSYEKKMVKLMNRLPAIEDLRLKARKRMPFVSQEYMEAGTDNEVSLQRNLDSFSTVSIKPKFLKGSLKPNIKTTLFGQTYNAPFGIAPIGLTGLMWPKAEIYFAKAAVKYNIPMSLSTVATETPESVSKHVGNNGWFQLYTPKEIDLTKALLERVKAAGFKTLVITVDIPVPSGRQRTKRAGLQMPPKITANFIWQGIKHPAWSIGTIKRGLPRLRTVQDYSEFKSMMSVGAFVTEQLGGNLSWDYVSQIRDLWDGPVILKGIMHKEDALKAVHLGFDGIVISNHGARQFDGCPSSLSALQEISPAIKGKTAIIFDSGIRTGLDIMKAIAMGADFVLCGRAYLYGVGALGEIGPEHTTKILSNELKNAMIQVGIESMEHLKSLEYKVINP